MNPTEIKELKGLFLNEINEVLHRVIDADQLTDLYPLIRKVERQCDTFRAGLIAVVRNTRDNGSK